MEATAAATGEPAVIAATRRLSGASDADRPDAADAMTRLSAVRVGAAPSPAVPTAAPRLLTAAWEDFTDLAESAGAVSSAWATPAPANAAPTPNVSAPAPSQAYGGRRRRADR
ncbi:MAG: hypothetical protein ACOYEV_15370 [Candidatus Nanopelagicales bacterium]